MLESNAAQYVGRSERQHGWLDIDAVGSLAATVDDTRATDGSSMQYLSHWCAFTPCVLTEDLFADRHPKLAEFAAPVQLKRRKWVGGSREVHDPPHICDQMKRTLKMTVSVENEGAAGLMVFVTFENELFEGMTSAISEKQDIVYLDIPAATSPPCSEPTPTAPNLIEPVEMCKTLQLFYSALTFNTGRATRCHAFAARVQLAGYSSDTPFRRSAPEWP